MKKIIFISLLFISMLSFMSLTKFEMKGATAKVEIEKNTQVSENQSISTPFQSEKNVQNTVNQRLTEKQIEQISKSLNVNLTTNQPPLTPSEIVKYLLSLIGTFITSLILIFLNKKFPKWFPSPNKNKYL